MSQLSLFGENPSSHSGARINNDPMKEQKRIAEALRFRSLPEPYGKPDKRGKRAYERFNENASKIGEREKQIFLDMLLTMPADRVEKIIEIGDMWRKCSAIECEDIRRSYGI